VALNNASAAARDAGDFDRSLELANLATDVACKIDALDILMLAAQNKAYALLELGRYDRAEAVLGEAVGHYAATRHLLRAGDVLDASLYAALHRMEERGWVEAEWGVSDRGKRAKFYRLTTAGRGRLRVESATWRQYAAAVAKLLNAQTEPA